MTDSERMDWLEAKSIGHRVVISRSRVTGLFRVHAVVGDGKGVHGVRAAIDRAIEAEKRKELGLKR